MNPGNSVRDASRPGQDDAGRPAAAGPPESTPEPPPGIPRPQRPLEDIQEIIGKLAAVTRQLNGRGDVGSLDDLGDLGDFGSLDDLGSLGDASG